MITFHSEPYVRRQYDIPQKQRRSRSRNRNDRNAYDNWMEERLSRPTQRSQIQKGNSVAVQEDSYGHKVNECFYSVPVPIEENHTVIENDAGFLAQKINMMGRVEWNRQFPKATIVIYTDGSCMPDIASGFGIYHGPAHELNRAYKLHGPEHNSGFAEIVAVITALNDLRFWNKFKGEKVIIRTDYLPLIQAMQNDGQHENSRFAANYSLLRDICAEFLNGVSFQHVYAHDINGDAGNDAADELARQAVDYGVPRRSRSKSVERKKKRDRSRERGRNASRNNVRAHIRSHSAFVPGSKRT